MRSRSPELPGGKPREARSQSPELPGRAEWLWCVGAEDNLRERCRVLEAERDELQERLTALELKGESAGARNAQLEARRTLLVDEASRMREQIEVLADLAEQEQMSHASAMAAALENLSSLQVSKSDDADVVAPGSGCNRLESHLAGADAAEDDVVISQHQPQDAIVAYLESTTSLWAAVAVREECACHEVPEDRLGASSTCLYDSSELSDALTDDSGESSDEVGAPALETQAMEQEEEQEGDAEFDEGLVTLHREGLLQPEELCPCDSGQSFGACHFLLLALGQACACKASPHSSAGSPAATGS